MKNMETKSISIEVKDVDTGKRTAVLAHAVYGNVDRTKDISVKGMFTKSWKENPDVDFLFNHKTDEIPGNVTRLFEDEQKAYTEVKFGKWSLGNDVLEMADSGILRGVSFGYIAEKKDFIEVKGQKVRRLKEVWHKETSALTQYPANPLTSVISVTKSFDGLELKRLSESENIMLKRILLSDQSVLEQLVSLSGGLDVTSDLYTWINWNIERRSSMIGDIRSQLKYNAPEIASMKSYVEQMETFCRNSRCSEGTIISIMGEVQDVKNILTEYDTASTGFASQQDASIQAKNMETINNFIKTLN
jgi:HK97 family phage prohead protease